MHHIGEEPMPGFRCPECGSEMVNVVFSHLFPNGREVRQILTCPNCGWFDRDNFEASGEEMTVVPNGP